MKKIIALTAALAAAAVPVATAAKPPKPPRNAKLNSTVKPTAITFGKFVTTSGHLTSNTANVPVELQADPYPFDGKWVTRGTKNTDAKGDVSFALAPDLNTKLRLQTSGAPKLGVQVGRERKAHVTLGVGVDRKSTRLNSSHTVISYAVLCL